MNIVYFPDPKVHPQWRLLVEHFGHIGYDTLLKHEELSAAMDMNPLKQMKQKEARQYYDQVGVFRRAMLRDRQMYLETIPGVGYRVVRPNEHSRHALREARLGNRRYNKAIEVATSVNVAALTEKEVTENALVQGRLGAIHMAMKKDVIELRKALAEPKKQERVALPSAVM